MSKKIGKEDKQKEADVSLSPKNPCLYTLRRRDSNSGDSILLALIRCWITNSDIHTPISTVMKGCTCSFWY